MPADLYTWQRVIVLLHKYHDEYSLHHRSLQLNAHLPKVVFENDLDSGTIFRFYSILQGCHKIPSSKFKDILRIFLRFSRMFKLGPTHVKLARSGGDSNNLHAIYCIEHRIQGFQGSFSKFKDLSRILENVYYNSRTFQGFQGST